MIYDIYTYIYIFIIIYIYIWKYSNRTLGMIYDDDMFVLEMDFLDMRC